MQPTHVYEVRPRKDKRGVDLISDLLPFGRLWYGALNAISNAIGVHHRLNLMQAKPLPLLRRCSAPTVTEHYRLQDLTPR
jgi:hypothetical protein